MTAFVHNLPAAESISVQTGTHPTPPMRVALVHDWLTGMRGGEKVLELLCRRFPEAPVWTLLYVPGSVSADITNRPIYTSLLQHMPFAATRYRNYLPLFPAFAELHKARHADLVISSSHAIAKSMVRGGPNRPFHICYIHTPMRYVWDMFDDYFGSARVGPLLSKLFFRPIANALQAYDLRTTGRVDLFVANSTHVAERVKRIYGRRCTVLHPPVDVDRFLQVAREPEHRYLVVSALVPYKRVEHAIRATAVLGRPLTVVGTGPELDSLRKLAASLCADVIFTGAVSDAALAQCYRTARALLFPGVEDFGIVPVEAIASGCPVIALGQGGILDSMTDSTAVLYGSPTVQGLTDAVMEFERREHSFCEADLRAHATLFSEEAFRQGLEEVLRQVLPQVACLRKHSLSECPGCSL